MPHRPLQPLVLAVDLVREYDLVTVARKRSFHLAKHLEVIRYVGRATTARGSKPSIEVGSGRTVHVMPSALSAIPMFALTMLGFPHASR